jgi:flagellar basal body-associated protein FliL
MDQKNKKMVLFILLVLVIVVSCSVTWVVMEREFNKAEIDAKGFDMEELPEGAFGGGKVKINITS